jgi:hypothetical protein
MAAIAPGAHASPSTWPRTLIRGAAIEAAPIEACRKTDGLRFVLDVT